MRRVVEFAPETPPRSMRLAPHVWRDDVAWKIEIIPELRMWDEERSFVLKINTQRHGTLFEIDKLGEGIVSFFAYSKVPADASGENAILDESGFATVIWNISEHYGTVSDDQQKILIIEFFEAFKFSWGSGVGRHGDADPVNVLVVFDAPNPN